MWEDAPVTENNLANYMALGPDGTVPGATPEDPNKNIAEIDEELKNAKHPVAVQALQEARAQEVAKLNGVKWEDAPTQSAKQPQWENAPKDTEPSLMDGLKYAGEGLLNVASGVPAGLMGGLGYLGTAAATGGDMDAAKAVQQSVQDKFTYQPRSAPGQQAVADIGEGFGSVINAGGKAVQGINSAFGNLADPEAADAIGRAGTEMAMNVMDPMMLTGMGHGMMGGGDFSHIMDHANKLQDIANQKVEPTVQPQGQQVGPSDRGVAPTPDAPQGNLFSPDQKPTEPISGDNQMSLLEPQQDHTGNTIPYEPLSLGDGPPQAAKPELQMPQVPDRLGLVPKEDLSTPDLNQTKVTQAGLLENQRAAERPIDTTNDAMAEAYKKAQQDQAYKALNDSKEAAYDEIQKQAQASDVAKREVETAQLNGDLDYQHVKDVVGDKTLMPLDDTRPMTDALKSGDLKGALDVIANKHPDVVYRDLATYLSSKADGLQTFLHNDPTIQAGDRSISGYFDPNTNTVGFSGVGATSPHTVMHEVTHGLTSQFLDANPNDIKTVALKTLYNKLDTSQFPSITNLKEFVAEAFSNPKFQDYLKTQTIDNRSMFSKFVDGVKTLFGIKTDATTNITNALSHAIDLAKQVIEVSDPQARKYMMDQFKQSGLPSKLSDLMSSKPEDVHTTTIGDITKTVGKLVGMDKMREQFDFTPQAPKDVVKAALAAPDIKAGTLETVKANLDAGGRFASLRHDNNPIVKATFSYIDDAVKKYTNSVKEAITNKDNGIKTLLQKLPKDDFTIVHSQMMLDEGQKIRTPQELSHMQWSQPMIDFYQRFRQIDDIVLAESNKVRAGMNPPLEPMTARVGHLAGRFLGDFSHMVYERRPDGTRGNAVIRVNGQTKWGAQKIADFIKGEHPEWEVAGQEYKPINTARNSDRFQGFRELMNYVGKNDPVVGKALDTLDKYNKSTATQYRAAVQHALDKKVQAGGIIGSEGNKFWLDAQTNAEQGFKGHLAYLDTTFKWLEMQKAMDNVSKVTTNKDVINQQPNAIKWAMAYTDHALNRNQGFLADFAANVLSEVGRVTGVGHTGIQKGIGFLSSFEMRNWMGIGNIPFALKHMLLPFQKMPAMVAYLKTVGTADGSLIAAGTHSLDSYYKYLRDDTKNASPFQKQAFDYAKKNGIFSVDLSDTSGKIQSSKVGRFMGKFADADFSGPEHAIRGTSFFFYAHLLEDSGMAPQSALSAAENLSKFLYTDYAPHEAPRAIAKGGWMGQLALQITRYKANELSQLGFFNRERIPFTDSEHSIMQKVMSNAPLMTHIASSLAFTGVTGMLAYNEMDKVYSEFQKHVMGKPDNLTALMQRTNAPDLVKYGLSSLLGIDSKISEADLLPSPFPTTKSEIDQLGLAWNAAKFHDAFHAKQLALGMSPSTVRGPLENAMFTQQTSKPGMGLYMNPNTGQGRVYRDEKTQTIRNFGFHTTAETNELNNNYSQSRIMQDHADLADHVMEHAKGAIASNSLTPDLVKELGQKYAQHQQAGQPDFANALTSYMESRQMSQRQQMQLRQATQDKMGNGLKIMNGQ